MMVNKKRIARYASLIAIVMLIISCRKEVAVRHIIPPNPYKVIDSVIQDSLFHFGNKCYVLITVNGKTVFSNGYGGYQDSSVLKIASCTKWLSGAVLMSLVDQGKLSLNDTIGSYLPLFSRYAKGNITLAQLFSHTSGFPGSSV